MMKQPSSHTPGQVGRPVIAIDVGGTKVLTALFTADGKLLDKETIPTLAEQGLEKTLTRMFGVIKSLLKRQSLTASQIGAICIAAAGGVDTAKGVVVTPSPHLPGWTNAPIAASFEAQLGIKTYVLNDASAAALGEHRYGAGKGVQNLVMFTLGTGIGGGIIIDGRLYLGAVGGAGELGHMTVEANGPKCGCGNTGCLEMLVSGSAIERDAAARLAKGDPSLLADRAGKPDNKFTAPEIAAAARRGDKLAQDVIARAAYYLGVGFVNVINIFNPELIIYGGGLAEIGEMLVSPAIKLAAERPFAINARAVRIVKAGLTNEAGIYGAAAYAMDMMRRQS
jgi:glucokinase